MILTWIVENKEAKKGRIFKKKLNLYEIIRFHNCFTEPELPATKNRMKPRMLWKPEFAIKDMHLNHSLIGFSHHQIHQRQT